jgi:iron complex transport system permease protein
LDLELSGGRSKIKICFLLIGSAVLGGIVLSVADLVARLMLAPAELPIGIVTSLVGVPVFIYLLRKNQYYV